MKNTAGDCQAAGGATPPKECQPATYI